MSSNFNETTKRTRPPFRYDVVGSFLRTKEIKDARSDFAAGKITKAQLGEIEDAEIRKLVAKEKEAGLKIVTDGEFRRSYWHLDFFWGFDGVEHTQRQRGGTAFHGATLRPDGAALKGKLGFSNHPFLEHYKFLKEAAGNDVLTKQTIPSPSQFFSIITREGGDKIADEIYPNREDLYSDIIDVYRKAILAFYDLGCRNVQLDDCTWGKYCDSHYSSLPDAKATMDLYLRLNNGAIANLPDDLVVTTHVCRGNFRSSWASSGGYEPVAKHLLGGENVDGYFLEYDTDRAGGFEPLKELSGDKIVVLGLVTSKSGDIEDKDTIVSRIHEAAKYVPADRLCLSPQCGFASTEEGNVLTEEQQWKKIAFIKEIAEEVWQ